MSKQSVVVELSKGEYLLNVDLTSVSVTRDYEKAYKFSGRADASDALSWAEWHESYPKAQLLFKFFD